MVEICIPKKSYVFCFSILTVYDVTRLTAKFKFQVMAKQIILKERDVIEANVKKFWNKKCKSSSKDTLLGVLHAIVSAEGVRARALVPNAIEGNHLNNF